MHKKEQIIAADEDKDEQFCQEIMNTYKEQFQPRKRTGLFSGRMQKRAVDIPAPMGFFS